MNAIEFIAKIENGIIRLPKRYGAYNNSTVRILILTDRAEVAPPSKEGLLAAMLQLQEKDIFPTITDVVEWQKQQRDEWE